MLIAFMKNASQTRKAAAVTASALVLVVAVAGLFLAGSPAAERRRQIDVQRVNALSQIANGVDGAYAADGHLPASLDALIARANQKNDIYLGTTADPVTGAPYEYRVLSADKYELCATFDADTVNSEYDAYGSVRPAPAPSMPMGYPGYRSWEHAAGRVCFELTPVSNVPTVACSITNPCMAPNTTCAQLPGKGTFCVPQGKECLAAGCDESMCTIAESYPVQVRCNALPAHGDEGDQPVTDRPITCNLMKSSATGQMACFGCGSQICNKPGPEWEHYAPSGEMGIPYSCYDDESGKCALAQ